MTPAAIRGVLGGEKVDATKLEKGFKHDIFQVLLGFFTVSQSAVQINSLPFHGQDKKKKQQL